MVCLLEILTLQLAILLSLRVMSIGMMLDKLYLRKFVDLGVIVILRFIFTVPKSKIPLSIPGWFL